MHATSAKSARALIYSGGQGISQDSKCSPMNASWKNEGMKEEMVLKGSPSPQCVFVSQEQFWGQVYPAHT